MIDIVRFNNGNIAWQFVEFPSINEVTGTLKVIEFGAQIDFEVKRIFYLCDLKSNASRGFHAHEELKQFLFCVSGSFDLLLDSGTTTKTYRMTSESPGVLIDGGVWREMHQFTEGTVMMVLCDREYRFDTVVRDYELFKKNIGASSLGI